MVLFHALYFLTSNTDQKLSDHGIYPAEKVDTFKSQPRRLHCRDQNNNIWDLPAVPNFILAGTQKGGTTALRNILVKHPSMVASLEFERHYFDKKIFRYLQKTYRQSGQSLWKDEWLCDLQRHYIQSTWHSSMLEKSEGLFFYEKTPSYLVDPDVPAWIHRVCPWTKVVVILRNPIDRAFSHYKMEREKVRVKQDFTAVVKQEIHHLRALGLSHAPPLPETSNMELFLKEVGEDPFRIPSMEAGASDEGHKEFLRNFTSTNFLQRGMYSIQLQRWLKYFRLGESLLVLKFEDLQADPAKVYESILDFLGASRFSLSLEDFQKSYQTRGQYRRKGMIHPPMTNQTRLYLERFFQAYNDELAALLGRNFY